MRAGKQDVPVEIMYRPTTLNAFGERTTNPADLVLWRAVWASFRPFRGGELSLAESVEHNPTGKFRFAYLDVMSPDENGRALSADMTLRIDGTELWDIDVIHVDRGTKKDVEVWAILKRFVV